MPTYFWSLYVKYESVSIKIVGYFLEETLNKTMQQVPISAKFCASSLRWQIELLTQYLHVHFNESLNNYKTTGSYFFQKSSNVLSHIIFTLRAQNVCLQRELRSQIMSDVDDTSETSEQSESCCSLNVRLSTWSQRLCACVYAGDSHFEHMM